MRRNGFQIFLLITLFLGFPEGRSQVIKGISPEHLDSLKNLEIEMQGQAELIIDAADFDTRKTTCFSFIRNLAAALSLPGSYNYPFDSLRQISITKSPDDKFRIFTWNLRNKDDAFRFYGAIQRNEKTGVTVIPLFDAGPLIRKPEDTIVDSKSWWGALYYKIIPVKVQNEMCYTLLGWNGSNKKSNKKVIDVLRFQEGTAVFGAPIFRAGANDIMHRVVFEYSNEVQHMILKYEPEKKYIVFDHLVPINPKATGFYELYYPDGSYDYFVFEKGYWVLKEKLFDNGTIRTANDDIEERTKKLKKQNPSDEKKKEDPKKETEEQQDTSKPKL
jgi:hypothetical protein